MNKFVKTERGVDVRIDDAYTNNSKYFFEPYVRPDGSESNFGSFKFRKPKEAKDILRQAVDVMKKDFRCEDTIFEGPYPKFIEDNYGVSLQVNGKVKFFKDVSAAEKVPQEEVEDTEFILELHLIASENQQTHERTIFLRVARATASGKSEKYNDALYDSADLPF